MPQRIAVHTIAVNHLNFSGCFRRYSHIVAITLLILGTPIFSSAENQIIASSTNQELSLASEPGLADLLQYGFRNNPSVLAAREAWNAAVEEYRSTTAYPDPRVMVTYFPEPIETRLGPQDWNASLSQAIPFPGKLSSKGNIKEAQANIRRLELDKAIRDLSVSIRETYHELLYIQTARGIAHQNAELLAQLRTVAETEHGADRATLMDVMKAQSQAGQVHYDLLLLKDLDQTERVKLNSLLNRATDAELGSIQDDPPRPLVYSIAEITEMAEESREEIKMASARIAMAEEGKDLAVMENLPDFQLGLFYASIGEPDLPSMPADAGRDAYGIQAGLSIPLWYGKSSGRLAKAKAEIRKAEAMKSARVNETRTLVRTVYFRLQNASRLMTLYREELLPQAIRAMELADTWYRQGQGSFSDWTETVTTWYNFQLALARAEADYGNYLARLEQVTGRALTAVAEPTVVEEASP